MSGFCFVFCSAGTSPFQQEMLPGISEYHSTKVHYVACRASPADHTNSTAPSLQDIQQVIEPARASVSVSEKRAPS
jgi:hypothetical protein